MDFILKKLPSRAIAISMFSSMESYCKSQEFIRCTSFFMKTQDALE